MKLSIAITLLFLATVAQAKVSTKEVRYKVDGKNFVGLMAWDSSMKGKRPGVLVVHEWWGHNSYTRSRAEQLAKLGYTAFALDMYGDGKTAGHPKEAGKMSGWVTKHMDVAEKRFRAALAQLKSHPTVNKDRIAAIGYCFGGGIVMNMALRGVPLKMVASFHGSLGNAVPDTVKGKDTLLFVANGAADTFISKETIQSFKSQMKANKIDYKFVNYPGAKHGFTNPDATANGKKFNIPLAYNKKADEQSWREMKQLFKKHL